MTKIVDFPNESLLFDEVAAPATPAAATVRLYAKADGLLYSKDDAGTETQLGGGGSTPTGTGFPHITAGVQDAAAKLVDTADVNDAQITYPKIQDVSATARALGRNTAGAGDVEEVTLTQILDWVGSAAQGDILYRGAASWSRLAAGTSGYVLTSQGAGADPVWAAAAGGAGAMTFVGEATVTGAAATTLTLSGLDLATDGSYYVEMALSNATGSTSTLSLFFNADTTATNYYKQYLAAGATTVSALRANDANVSFMEASETCTGNITINNDFDGKPRAMATTMSAAPASITLRHHAVVWNSVTNVTSMTISSSVASALDIGSYIKVFKLND